MKKHLKRVERRFECPEEKCHESKTRKNNVKRHLILVHGFGTDAARIKAKSLVAKEFEIRLTGKFLCFNCNETFASETNLKLHDRRYHMVGVYFNLLLIFKYFL